MTIDDQIRDRKLQYNINPILFAVSGVAYFIWGGRGGGGGAKMPCPCII